jgi:hypothetical protein
VLAHVTIFADPHATTVRTPGVGSAFVMALRILDWDLCMMTTLD